MDFVDIVHLITALRDLIASFSIHDHDSILLKASFQRLNLLNFEQICFLFHQSDIIGLVKSYIHYENSTDLQSCSIPVFGLLLLKLYLLLFYKCSDISFESYSTLFESQNDVQRYREDLSDFIFEEFKWIFSAAAKEVTDKQLRKGCEIFISKLLQIYHGCDHSFHDLFDSLLGTQEVNYNHLLLNHQYLMKSNNELRLALSPILDLLLTTLQSPLDQHYIFRLYDHVMMSPSWLENEVSIQLWNDFTLFLLCGASSVAIAHQIEGIFLDLKDKEASRHNQAKTIFMTEKMESLLDELTISSRSSKRLFLPLSRLVESWIVEGVIPVIQRSSSPIEKLKGLKFIFSILMVFAFSLEAETLLVLYHLTLEMFDSYQELLNNYGLCEIFEWEEIIICLLELVSRLSKSQIFEQSDNFSHSILSQTLERLFTYQSTLSSEMSTSREYLRSSRLFSRWFMIYLDFSWSVKFSSLSKILKQDFFAKRVETSLHFVVVGVECYLSFLQNWFDNIQYFPTFLKQHFFPELSDFSKGSNNNQAPLDLLDLTEAEDKIGSKPLLVEKVRNILISSFSTPPTATGQLAKGQTLSRFQYFRYFEKIDDLNRFLLNVQRDCVEDGKVSIDITDQVLSEMWKEDWGDMLDYTLCFMGDYLALFRFFFSFMVRENNTHLVDAFAGSLLDAVSFLSEFYLVPFQFLSSASSKREDLKAILQYHFMKLRSLTFFSQRIEFLEILMALVDQVMFLPTKKILESTNSPLKSPDKSDDQQPEILRRGLFEILVFFVVPGLHQIASEAEEASTTQKAWSLSLTQSLHHVTRYCQEVLYHYTEGKERVSVLRQLRTQASNGLFGGSSQVTAAMNMLNDLSGLHYYGVCSGYDNEIAEQTRLQLEELEAVLRSLRFLFDFFEKDPLQSKHQSIEMVWKTIVAPLEEDLIFTEIVEYLRQSPEILYYLSQLNSPSHEIEEPMLTNSRVQLVSHLLPVKQAFYSLIQLYRSYLTSYYQERSPLSGIAAANDLLSSDDSSISDITAILQSLQKKTDPAQVEKWLEEYFYRQYRLVLSEDVFLSTILQHLRLAETLAHYANVLYDQTATQSNSKGEKRHSRSQSLLLDLSPLAIAEEEKEKDKDIVEVLVEALVERSSRVRLLSFPRDLLHLERSRLFRLPLHLSYGLFSRGFVGKSLSSLCCHTSEHFAVVDDMVSAVLPLRSYFLPERGRKEDKNFHHSLLRDLLFDRNETVFQEISGPGDLLAVLFSVTAVQPRTKRLSARIRVINRSNFKIPYFLLRVMLSNNCLFAAENSQTIQTSSATSSSSLSLFPPDHLHIQKENMGLSLHFSETCFQELFSHDYFPPNGTIERELSFEYRFFAASQVVLRIEYPDLARNTQIFSFFDNSPAEPTKQEKQAMQSIVPSYLESNRVLFSNWSLPSNQQKSAQKWTAVIDLAPFHLSVAYLLRSYGDNHFTSMRYWTLRQCLQSCDAKEIVLFPIDLLLRDFPSDLVSSICPFSSSSRKILICDLTRRWEIFESQYLRLTGRRSHECSVVMFAPLLDPSSRHFTEPATIMTLLANIQDLMMSSPGNGLTGGLQTIGLDSIAINPSLRGLGWTLQTLWKDDISVQMTFDDLLSREDVGSENSQEIKATIRIRCQRSQILESILHDIDDFLFVLSGGFFLRC